MITWKTNGINGTVKVVESTNKVVVLELLQKVKNNRFVGHGSSVGELWFKDGKLFLKNIPFMSYYVTSQTIDFVTFITLINQNEKDWINV